MSAATASGKATSSAAAHIGSWKAVSRPVSASYTSHSFPVTPSVQLNRSPHSPTNTSWVVPMVMRS